MLRIEGRRRDGRRGTSQVEMALAISFLIVLLVGIVDLGRAFYTYIVITNATREGARYGSLLPGDDAGILDATKAEGSAGGVVLVNADIDIDPNPAGPDDEEPGDGDGTTAGHGDPIAVSVIYDLDPIIGHLVGVNTFTLRARTEMMVLSGSGG
jgi:hypothetical protein